MKVNHDAVPFSPAVIAIAAVTGYVVRAPHFRLAKSPGRLTALGM
jgi:hypothetical protein